MATDLQGLGLGLASRFATNPIVQKYKLAKPAEKFAYISTKKGFEFAQKFLANKAKKQASGDIKALPAPPPLF